MPNQRLSTFFDLFLGRELNRQLDNWLSAAELLHGPARAIIAPYDCFVYPNLFVYNYL